MFDMRSKPLFVHDCDSCLFLGNPHKKEYDIYFCPQCDGGSIVIRHGDEGPDYYSTMISLALNRDPSNSEISALFLKIARQLLSDGMISVSVNHDMIEEKKLMWEDHWEMRK
jgi:hypothetical protein